MGCGVGRRDNNPLRFVKAHHEAVPPGPATGTLPDEAAAWMQQYAFSCSLDPSLVLGANGFLGSHVTRQLVERGVDVRAMIRPNANTIGIDDLPASASTANGATATLREAMGRLRRRLLLRGGHPGLAARSLRRCFAPMSRAPAVSWRWHGRRT